MRLFRIKRFIYCLPRAGAQISRTKEGYFQVADNDRIYRTPDGRRVTRETPGALYVFLGLSDEYYSRVPGFGGKRKRVKLCTDKTASKQMLAKLLTDAALVEHGMADPDRQEQYNRPLAEHLEDYHRHLLAKGNCQDHSDKTVARIRTIIDGCKFQAITDLSASAVAEFLHELRRDPGRPALPPGQEWFKPAELAQALCGERPQQLARILRREKLHAEGDGRKRRYPRATVEALQDIYCRGIGISTSNGYLTAMRGFSRWLVRDRRMAEDPLAMLARLNAKTDVRHERRALPEAELRELLLAAGVNPALFGELMGSDRAMLYAVAMTTGYRAAELASLCPPSFDLADEGPTVTVRAAYSKNRREAVQPLPLDVAAALRVYLHGRPADRPVWPGDWHKDAAEMLRGDLAEAGIPYRDDDGRVCDFHALRHSYITLLERSGVSPKLAQELARHSDIRLTMNVYAYARLHDLASAVEGLPALLGSSDGERQVMKATGTDASFQSQLKAPGPRPAHLRDATRDRRIPVDKATDTVMVRDDVQQTAENMWFESDGDSLRLAENPAWIRTRTKRTKIGCSPQHQRRNIASF